MKEIKKEKNPREVLRGAEDGMRDDDRHSRCVAYDLLMEWRGAQR